MKRANCNTILAAFILTCFIWVAKPADAQTHTQIILPAAPTSGWDSKKLKVGDAVDLKTTASLDLQNGSIIPKGAKIIGHVTESKSKSKGDSESSLGIVFDKIDLADGKTLTVSGVMQAVAPAAGDTTEGGGGVNYGGSMNQGLQRSADAGTTYSTHVPTLNEQSVGAIGLKNLTLGSDGVLKSSDKSVKVELQTQVLLRAQVTGN